MMQFLSQPWPWYVAGPLIGLIVPLLLLIGGRRFGVSSNLRHICAATLPGRVDFFQYDWKRSGGWNLVFIFGVLVGGVISAVWLHNPEPIVISEATRADLTALGIRDFQGFVPDNLISMDALATAPGFIAVVVGGFLVGFGARYAGGCTSGHAISGLADLQKASLIAVVGFFIGGLLVTHILLPVML